MDRKDKKKRPYKPPTIKTGKVFERKSLACGKNNPGLFNCLSNPKFS